MVAFLGFSLVLTHNHAGEYSHPFCEKSMLVALIWEWWRGYGDVGEGENSV
jgi:hypothetical protein